jgi:hypothetical protein
VSNLKHFGISGSSYYIEITLAWLWSDLVQMYYIVYEIEICRKSSDVSGCVLA